MINGHMINGAMINGSGVTVSHGNLAVTGRRGSADGYGYHSEPDGLAVTGRRGSGEAYGGGILTATGRRGSCAATGSGDSMGRLSVTGRRGSLSATIVADWMGNLSVTGRRGSGEGFGGGILEVVGRRGSATATATADWTARCSVTGRRGTLAATGYHDSVGVLNVTGRRALSLFGTLNVAGRRGTAIATGTFAETLAAIAYAMNLRAGGMVPYSNYDFDFIVRHQGQTYGLNSVGCYLLEGDDDNGTYIDAYVELPPLDFGETREKRMDSIYIGTRTAGAMTVRADVDEGTQATVNTATVGRNKRAKLPKGLKGRYWGFKVSNASGSNIDIDNIEILPAISERKARV